MCQFRSSDASRFGRPSLTDVQSRWRRSMLKARFRKSAWSLERPGWIETRPAAQGVTRPFRLSCVRRIGAQLEGQEMSKQDSVVKIYMGTSEADAMFADTRRAIRITPHSIA